MKKYRQIKKYKHIENTGLAWVNKVGEFKNAVAPQKIAINFPQNYICK